MKTQLIISEEKILFNLYQGVIRNGYIGTGRHTSKGKDYVQEAFNLILKLNISKKNYVIGNDAPKGGYSGDFIKLTSQGKKLVSIKNAVKNYQSRLDSKKDKELKKNKNNWMTKLQNLCSERLNCDNSKNHNKSLNKQIRNYAELLQIECPEEQSEFQKFIKIHAS